jgi:hypothetical protein
VLFVHIHLQPGARQVSGGVSPAMPAPMMRTDLGMSFTHPGFQKSPGFDASPNPKKENQEEQDFGVQDKTGNQTAQ